MSNRKIHINNQKDKASLGRKNKSKSFLNQIGNRLKGKSLKEGDVKVNPKLVKAAQRTAVGQKLKKAAKFNPKRRAEFELQKKAKELARPANKVVRKVQKANKFDPKKKLEFEAQRATKKTSLGKKIGELKRLNPLTLGKKKARKAINKTAFGKAKKNLERTTGLNILEETKLIPKAKKLSLEDLKSKKDGKTIIPQSRNLAEIQDRKKQKEKLKKGLKKSIKLGGMALLLLVGAVVAFNALTQKNEEPIAEEKSKAPKFGVDFKAFDAETKVLQKTQSLGLTLDELNLSQSEVYQMERAIMENDGLESLEKDKKVYVLKSKKDGALMHFIYEYSPNLYMKLNFKEVNMVEMVTQATDSKVTETGFVVQSSLMETILETGLRYDLIEKIEETMASKIDLFRVKTGDEFKLIYEQQLVNDELVGTGDLLAIAYKPVNGKTVKGYYFEGQEYPYFDETARPMKSSFLLAPVSIAKITSAFGPRFHPILKKSKPHNGTDYAAPEGTPIFSVADGEIIKAEFGKFNGNYVKIKHDDTYKTQYLHMSQIAPGMVPGRKVSQGETIGFVGSTGLATGPHVCFRFWKNDVQVNHLTENLPQLKQLPFEEMLKFDKLRSEMNTLLDNTVVY